MQEKKVNARQKRANMGKKDKQVNADVCQAIWVKMDVGVVIRW